MERRTFLALLPGSLLAAPLAAEAQPTGKVPRIGYLALQPAANPHLHEAFRQGLRDLGYVERRNVVIEYRDAEGKLERLPSLAAELVALKVDVLVAQPTVAALAAKQATRTLPIVFPVADPVASGLVTSLARPGGNVTGLSFFGPELVFRIGSQVNICHGILQGGNPWPITFVPSSSARPIGVNWSACSGRPPCAPGSIGERGRSC